MHKENHAFFFISPVSPTMAILTKEEYRHACSALRISKDATVNGTDGKGNIYKCRLTEECGRTGEVEIVDAAFQAAFFSGLCIYLGLPEREAFEEALMGLTALGAANIVPLVCGYCQEKWWEPWENRIERLNRKMIAAIKQSRNPWLPVLHAPRCFTEATHMACREASDTTIRIVADPGGVGIKTALRGTKRIDRIDCFIGPPGGFSPDEAALFSSGNFLSVKIAPYRLRTEIAAIAACAGIMQHHISGVDQAARTASPEIE